MKHVIAYLLLAPYNNEQNDLMCRRLTVKDCEKIPLYLLVLIYTFIFILLPLLTLLVT